LTDLVGLDWDGTTEWVARVNPTTASVTHVAPISGVSSSYAGDSTFDSAGHRLFIWASGSSLPTTFLVLDSDTGALLYSAQWTLLFANPEYDAFHGDIVGLQWDGTNTWLARVNVANAAVTPVAIIPGLQFTQPGHSTFDVQGQRLFVFGGGPSLPDALLSLDSNTGAVLASIAWPVDFTYPEYDG